MRGSRLFAYIVMLFVLLASAQTAAAATGGTAFETAKERRAKKAKRYRLRAVPGPTGTIAENGLAAAPVEAPPGVHAAIEAANRIVGKPYKYGGGHAKVEDTGYDCSGTISYALLGGGLLKAPLDSSSFMRWGQEGPGRWITVWTNPGHAFLVIAGLRLDTSAAGDPSGSKGPRWRPLLRSSRGFTPRHPVGF